MKFFATIAALALVSETGALQLNDDIQLPEEEQLFLQLAAETDKEAAKGKGNWWGDLAVHNWRELYPNKAALDYTDPVREAHSDTVQGHLSGQKFTHYHNSAEELNDVITSVKGENKGDAQY